MHGHIAKHYIVLTIELRIYFNKNKTKGKNDLFINVMGVCSACMLGHRSMLLNYSKSKY